MAFDRGTRANVALVFFDTEFTDLACDCKLISIGLVSEDGHRTFYAELTGTYQLSDCSDFVREAVLPQLEGRPSMMTMQEMSERLWGWLEAFSQPVKLATDSLSWDWPWITKIFDEVGSWPPNVDPKPQILAQGISFNVAVEQAFANGLRRHHALDDAKANRLAWVANCSGDSSDDSE